MAPLQSVVPGGYDAPPPSLPDDDGGGSLGDWLKRARERRGLTLERIAIETRIPRRHLEALERDNLAAMPPGFYCRAQIRAYARAVGADEGGALARLQSVTQASAPAAAARSIPRTEELTFRGRPVLIAFVVAITAIALWRATAEPAPTLAPEAQRRVRDESPAAPGRPPSPSETVPEPSIQAAEVPVTVNAVTELTVTTQPPGARVTVNGIGWGNSPVTIRNLPPGGKRVRVSKEGYAAQERELQLPAGRPRALDIQLDGAP